MPVCVSGVPAFVIDELEPRHGKCVEEGEHGDVATVEPAQYMRHAFGAFELILVGHGHIMRHNYPVHATLHPSPGSSDGLAAPVYSPGAANVISSVESCAVPSCTGPEEG